MKRCKVCGAELDWRKRSDRQTCSANCRKMWSRRHDAVDKAVATALAELGTLRRLVKQYPDLADEINTKVRRIQDECRDVLRLRPDAEELARWNLLYNQARKRDPV